MKSVSRIAVLGLGYVGLPLAVALARYFRVTGYDIDSSRISELRAGLDRTREVPNAVLESAGLQLVDMIEDLKGADLFIVAVPTPVDAINRPDLKALEEASQAVGSVLAKGAVVVFESTVYPGVTEEFCGPILETASGLRSGIDFFLGYSPERMNPGDKEHTLERITKVVAGQTSEVETILRDVYGRLNDNNIFIAHDIRTAEAAKVIENTQRDINIAFINEAADIFGKLGLSVYDVLDAAATKWNFLDFRPGLVGGHCIGIDPFYLAHCSEEQGINPEIVLAGRRINDRMGSKLAERIHEEIQATFPDAVSARVLVLGLTFKENLPDLRNTKVVDLIQGLEARGHKVDVHDVYADPEEAKRLYGIELMSTLDCVEPYHCLVGAVCHADYCKFQGQSFLSLLMPQGLIADVKGMWRDVSFPKGMKRWQL